MGYWIQHRKERRPKVTPTSAKLALRKLAEWGPARAVAAIEQSIANGWQGIFESRNPPAKPAPRRLTPDQADQRQREAVNAADERRRAEQSAQEDQLKRTRAVLECSPETVKRLHAECVEAAPENFRAKLAKANPTGGGMLTNLIYARIEAERIAKKAEVRQ